MFLVVGWYGIVRIGDSGAYDSEAFKEYAAMFRVDGRLPSERENYEYSLPPGYPLLGAYLDRVTEWADLNPGRPLGSIQPGLVAWSRRCSPDSPSSRWSSPGNARPPGSLGLPRPS